MSCEVSAVRPVTAVAAIPAAVVAVLAVPVRSPVTSPSKFATNVPVVIERLPVEAPVKDPVPTMNLSALSSKPMKALSLLPLSMTRPASLLGDPEVPFASSIIESVTVVFVVSIVVVVPLTSKFPETTKLLNVTLSVVPTA